MKKSEKKIVIATGYGHFAAHFIVLIFPALVMPLSREFSLNPGEIISMGFLLYLCYGIFALAWGALSDKIKPSIVLGMGLIISGSGLILVGLSHSICLIKVSLALVGIGSSTYHPAGLGLLSRGVTKRGKALGINGLLGNLGIALAPIVSGIGVYFLNWRLYLTLVGGIAILFSLFYFVIKLEIKHSVDKQQTTLPITTKTLVIFVVMMVGMLFSGLLYRGFTVSLPAFVENKLSDIVVLIGKSGLINFGENIFSDNFNTLFATLVASLIYFIAILGQVVGGMVADKFDLKISYFLYYIIAFPFLLGLIFVSGWTFIIFAGIFAFFSLGIQPIENSFIAMITPAKIRSLSYGIKFTVTFGGGSIAVFLIQFVEKKYDFMRASFLLPLFLSLLLLNISVILILSRGKHFKHKHETNP